MDSNKATLEEIQLEYTIVFIVIVVLSVLAIFVISLGLGYLFCSRKNRSGFHDNKEDSKLLSKGQATLRGLASHKSFNVNGAVATAVVPKDDDRRIGHSADDQVSLPRMKPPAYEYPMHLLFAPIDKKSTNI